MKTFPAPRIPALARGPRLQVERYFSPTPISARRFFDRLLHLRRDRPSSRRKVTVWIFWAIGAYCVNMPRGRLRAALAETRDCIPPCRVHRVKAGDDIWLEPCLQEAADSGSCRFQSR